MIEREADQSRGERGSFRALTPEVVEARILRRVAELRVLAAWTSVLADRAEAQRRVPRWRGPILAASLPLRSYIQLASKADVNSRHG